MNIKDPWKYLAFPASAVSAFFTVQLLIDDFSQITGLNEVNSQIALLAGTGLVIGFLVDEMLPAYIEKVREGSSSSGGDGGFGGDGGETDFGGGDDGGGDDFDF